MSEVILVEYQSVQREQNVQQWLLRILHTESYNSDKVFDLCLRTVGCWSHGWEVDWETTNLFDSCMCKLVAFAVTCEGPS